MKSFLDFIKEKQETQLNKQIINEGFKNSEMDKALDLLTKLLKKNITTGRVLRFTQTMDTKVDGKACTSVVFLVYSEDNTQTFTFNFLDKGKSSEVYSISIFDSPNLVWKGTDKAKVTIYTMGSSIVYFLPLIYHSINHHDYNLKQGSLQKYAKNIDIKESYRPFFIGAVQYNIFEGLSDEYVFEQYANKVGIIVNEASDELKSKKKEIYGELKNAWANRSKLDKDFVKNLESDYYSIVKAIKGGAEEIEDLDIEFKSNVVVEILQSGSEKKAQDEIEKAEEEHEDPSVAWKEMAKYLNMVVKGLNPSLLIAGAPGVGKTFKVKRHLKAKGYQEGQNLWTIKGKCSPRQLYIALYNFKEKGDIVLIDDADGLVGPKAPEDVINILKAALDSTSDDEGRMISYNIAGKLEDEEGVPIPKKFYYNGGVIVLTNYRAGQLDTALRGRSFIQDINFTVQDILIIIERLLPELGDGKWSMESKQKAFDYIKKLSEDKSSTIELSIRTFGICAKLFEACSDDPDFSDDDCRKMIGKQLKLQAERGGRHY